MDLYIIRQDFIYKIKHNNLFLDKILQDNKN